MESIIPFSYNHLIAWSNTLAQQEPFIHNNDLQRWFEFVVALVDNNESEKLSSEELESWLKEYKHWNENVRVYIKLCQGTIKSTDTV